MLFCINVRICPYFKSHNIVRRPKGDNYEVFNGYHALSAKGNRNLKRGQRVCVGETGASHQSTSRQSIQIWTETELPERHTGVLLAGLLQSDQRFGPPAHRTHWGSLGCAAFQRTGISIVDQQTLWDPHTKGNIQVLDKWTPVVNDCWVLGGVHRRADFGLVSVRTLKNLWDFNQSFHIVTAREILGLLNFGYSVKEHPNVVKLICTNPGKAQEATIQAYDTFMKDKQRTGVDSIRSILVMDPALKNEIRGFDRSRLRHVIPPR